MAESRFAELKEKEKQARKQIVIESALALFAKNPFYKVGMRDVADEAGISPITGILMTFRNHPLKDKNSSREHIIKIVKITSLLYSDQLLEN